MRVSRAIHGVLAVTGALVLGLVVPAQAAVPAPVLAVQAQGKQAGEFSARVLVTVRCSGGAVVQDVFVEAVQDDVRGSGSGGGAVVCDGRRRVVEVVVASSGAPFEVGYADVRAELLLLDPVHQDPLTLVVSERRVWLVAPIQARVDTPVLLHDDGSITVGVRVRCQTPWIEAGFSVEARQRGGTVGAGASVTGPVCDGAWHPYRFRLSADRPFWAVRTAVLVSGQVLEPEHFDPVGGMNVLADRAVRRV